MFMFLLKTIPHLLFMPVTVIALLGVIYSFFSPKRKTILFWIITVSCIFMIGWRIACHSVMISTRYYSILLYPALILTAYFCFQLESICSQGMRYLGADRIPNHDKICRIIPWIFIAGVAIASLIKIFHFNPNSDGIIKICQEYLKDRQGKEIVYTYEVNGTEHNRIRYYANIQEKGEPVTLLMNLRNNMLEDLMDFILNKRNIPGSYYFFCFLKKNEMELIPSEKILAGGEWREICRYSTSRTNKKEAILYCYTPFCNNIELWEKEIPQMSPNNLCLNGDFERFLKGKEQEQRIAYYKEIEAAEFYLTPERLFPENWWLGVTKSSKEKNATMALTAENPIAGKYSLEIHGNGDVMSGTNSGPIPKQDGVFSGFIMGKQESDVHVYSCFWDVARKETSYIEKFAFKVESDKTYKFTIPVLKKDVPEENENIFIIVQSSGHILLDNVEFISNQNNKINK